MGTLKTLESENLRKIQIVDKTAVDRVKFKEIFKSLKWIKLQGSTSFVEHLARRFTVARFGFILCMIEG